MNDAKTIKLHTGPVHAEAVVTTVYTLLKLLLEKPIPFYELVCLARNPEHEVFGNAAEAFAHLLSEQGGKMHNATREVIIASVKGDGLNMELRPFAEVTQSEEEVA